MSKSHNKFKTKNHQVVEESLASECPQTEEQVLPSEAQQPVPCLKTMLGVMDTDAYERLLKPSLVSYAQDLDDAPLRQLVEIMTTSIELCDDSSQYRKIADICQRYLYYQERISVETRMTCENVVSGGLCDYWRTQLFMMLFRDSASIFSLLIPSAKNIQTPFVSMAQDTFLEAVSQILNDSLEHGQTCHISNDCKPLYDFAHGVSLPWPGYETKYIFNLQSTVSDAFLQVKQSFALIDREVVADIYPKLVSHLRNLFLIDMIYTQYKKTFEDLTQVYSCHESLPSDLLDMLHQRIHLDKSYQNNLESMINGKECTQKCHKASRLEIQWFNTFGRILSMIRYASQNRMGVYLFHYIEP